MPQVSIQKQIKETIGAAITAVTNLENIGDENFFHALTCIKERKGKIIVTGVGKSGFIAMKMAATLVSLGHEARFLNPLDALHGDSGAIADGDVLIVFSFSGGSTELVTLMRHVRYHFAIGIITVTGNAESALAKLSDHVITFSISDEGCPLGLAPMASTTASLVIADAIASGLTSPEEFTPAHFAKFHPAGSLGLSLITVSEIMRTGDQLPKVEHSVTCADVLRVITHQTQTQIVGVVDEEGKLMGAIADGDIRRMVLEHGDVRDMSAATIMNRKPRTITHDANLKTALTQMTEYKINNIFVIDADNRYVGFVHMHDILR